MKKIFLAALLVSISVSAQNAENSKETKDARMVGSAFRNPFGGADKPKGSPYAQLAFAGAKVGTMTKTSFMRYNIFNDEFEFISSQNDTLVMDKIEDFNPITFIGTNKKYRLTPYTSNGKLVYGYLVTFYEKGGFSICKKENVTFYEARPAKTSLEQSLPAKFTRNDDWYFLKNKDNVVSEFPENKKQLVKLYPAKKAEIEAFLKENKISFTEDSDRIKIVDFLAAL